MKKIDYDILKTNDVLDGKTVDNYREIFFSSNENLPKIYDNLDFKGKNVLSVLGSGDQMFHAYNRGAKHIDVFDKNVLTIYYLYLRIWIMEYYGDYYPNRKMDSKYIKDLIEIVKPSTEKDYYYLEYWKKFVDKYPFFFSHLLFIFDKFGYRDNKLQDIDLIKKRISEREFDFYNFDIQKDIDLKKKYDLIIVSNIVDYVAYIGNYRENLYNLLNDGGKILSTNVCTCNPTDYEKLFFSQKFDFRKLPKTYESVYDYPGYVYTKK